MQAVFAWNSGTSGPTSTDSEEIIKSLPQIDEIISKNAPTWPLEKINRVDLAVLRCAIWELLIQKKTPPKVVIDEAVELSKEFGTETSSSFVNGCLGTIIKETENELDPRPADAN